MSFEEVATEMQAADPRVERSQMFGMPTLKVGKKVFAGVHGDEMTFKLDEASRLEALKLPGARIFEPMAGHAMKEWVQVPDKSSEHWVSLARQALSYVGAKRDN